MSYTQCSECGKRALSIATRCPGCGRELPPAVVPDRWSTDLASLGTAPFALGLVILVAVLATAWHGHRMTRPMEEESSFVAGGQSVGSKLDTAVAAATPAGPAVAPAATSELLVARNWTHVRAGRSVKSDLTAVLTPGDTVVADSLSRDWYRVAFEGEVMGYAYRSTLSPAR